MERMRRREFIKYSGGLLGLALLGKYTGLPLALRGSTGEVVDRATEAVPRQAEAVPGRAADGLATVVDKQTKFAMVIDVGACIGCRTCMWGCKKENTAVA